MQELIKEINLKIETIKGEIEDDEDHIDKARRRIEAHKDKIAELQGAIKKLEAPDAEDRHR